MTSDRLRSIAHWARGRIPELIVVAFGLGLRISLTQTYDVTLGYDYPSHLQFVKYIQEHWSIPPFGLNYTTYNPSLYYWLIAILFKVGCTVQAVGRVSIIASCLQLLLMWMGVEVYLRGWRLARVLALLMFATLPAALHLAGLLSNHALHDVFATAGTLLLPQFFLRQGRAAIRYAIGAGVCMGLALMTKVSSVSILEAFVLAVVIAVARSRGPRVEARALLPNLSVIFGIVALIAGWHYVRDKILYGRLVVMPFDAYADIDPVYKIPYLDRRTFGFVGYWNEDIYSHPFWPSGIRPYSRFWPTLMTTTFTDYFNFAFVPRPKPRQSAMMINGKPMLTAALQPARAAVWGGTILAALAVVAWLVSARTLWRRQDYARLMLVLVAMFATLNQLHFSVRFPYDNHGPTKGAYLQFAGPIFCVLAALGIAWLWNRRHPITRALAVVGMLGIVLSASYSVYAKIIVPLSG
jgi:4-amino-4-deoxy-L-arabinose transferase-like glycosyltransferase